MYIDLFVFSIPLVYVHVGTLFLLIPVILFADHEGFSWMRGNKETLNEKTLKILHRLVWTGLIVMITTGAIMFWPLRDYLLHNFAFYAKMVFVAVLIINSLFVGKLMLIATERSFESLSIEEKRPILISGVASSIGWIGAIISAIFMSTSGVLARILSVILDVL
jgi:nitrate reductase gamma subunit